jgi:thymidine phosphorylase
MRDVIRAQNGKNPDINSEELELWQHSFEVCAPADWKVKAIDMKHLNMVARMLWAPSDLTAWIYLCKKLGDKVKKEKLLWSVTVILKVNYEWLKISWIQDCLMRLNNICLLIDSCYIMKRH